MTLKELLVHCNLGLQELNSNIFGNVLDEELVIFLNEAVNTFISNIIKEEGNYLRNGFGYNVERVSQIQQLIKLKDIPLYQGSENLILEGDLPLDYRYYIRSSSNNKGNCEALTTTPQLIDKFIYILNFEFPTTFSNFYKDLKIKINNNLVYEVVTYFPNGIDDDSANFLILNNLLIVLKGLGYDISTGGNNIIIKSDTPLVFEIFNDADLINTINTIITIKKYYQFDLGIKSANRLIDNQDLNFLNRSSFDKTHLDSPLVELIKDKIRLSHDESFISNLINLVYICNPTKIDLYLNTVSELPDYVYTNSIIPMTIERISRVKSANNYQLQTDITRKE